MYYNLYDKLTFLAKSADGVISFKATNLNPFCSNLAMIVPTNPRWTASGFKAMKALNHDVFQYKDKFNNLILTSFVGHFLLMRGEKIFFSKTFCNVNLHAGYDLEV